MSEQRTPTQLHASMYANDHKENVNAVGRAVDKACAKYGAELSALRAENERLRRLLQYWFTIGERGVVLEKHRPIIKETHQALAERSDKCST